MTILKHVFVNKPKGAQYNLPEYHVPADRIMENYYTLEDALGQGKILGSNCTNNGSTDTETRLLCKTAYGIGNLVVAGDVVWIWEDGTDNVWRVVVDDKWATDELRFGYRGANDHDQVAGTLKTSGYDQTAFHNSLVMARQPFPNVAIGADLATLGPNKPTGDDLEVSPSDSTKVSTQVAENKTRLGNIADGDGLLDGIITPDMLNAPAFKTEAHENIIWGYFGVDNDLDGVVNGWKAYNSPSLLELVDTPIKIGPKSQKVVATQAGDGIEAEVIKPHLTADFAGEPLGFAVLVYATEADSVKVEVADNNGATASDAGGTAETWDWFGVVHMCHTTLTSLKFRAYATKATTFYISVAAVKPGKVQPRYTSNIGETVANILNQVDLSNWILNSYFEEWSAGTPGTFDKLPDWWQTDGAGVTMPTEITDELATWVFGGRSCKMKLAIGEGIYYDMPGSDYQNFYGDNVYLGAFFRGVSGDGTVRMTLDDGVNTDYVDYSFSGEQTEWKRPDVRMGIATNADKIRIKIHRIDANPGDIEVLIDAVMLSRIYDFAMAPQYVPQSHYSLMHWNFYISTVPVGGTDLMIHQGGAAEDVFPVGIVAYVHKIRVHEGTAQAASTTDTFRVLNDGAPTGLSLALTGAVQDGAAHYCGTGITFDEDDRLAVDAEATDPGTPTPGQNVGGYVEAYVLNK